MLVEIMAELCEIRSLPFLYIPILYLIITYKGNANDTFVGKNTEL